MNNFYDDTKKILRKLNESVALIGALMKLDGKLDPKDMFFDNQKLMNISKRTVQEWRNKKIIEFSQVGNKIYYRLKDIQVLLYENCNPKKKSAK